LNSPADPNDQCVIAFLKVPQRAPVKTRLSKSLDQEIVVSLYKNFVLDVLGMLQTGRHTTVICFYPPQALHEITSWLGCDHDYLPQQGDDLGKRMANAFDSIFQKGFRQVLLLGTDFPDLPGSIVDEAFESLHKNDAVIGPAVDGGYYLIGFNLHSFLPEVFDKIPWGSDTVFQKTITVLGSNRSRIHVLPPWRDIDTYQDLQFFIKRHAAKGSAASNTAAYLAGIKLRAIKR
jgi:rSAM/selenodomain-associated transferase 1